MSDQSSAQLEQEAEAARGRMADTADSIRKKLTAGQLIDEFSDMFTGGDMSGAVGNLKSQVRDNPLPVALIGAGVAWLAFGKGLSGTRSSSSAMRSPPRTHGVDTARRPGTHDGSMLSSVTEGTKAAAETVTDKVSGMADSLSATADRLRHSMLTGGSSRSSHSASAMAEQEPLLIAALGLTLGAVAGAMLPASELEKEQIGPYAERLRKQAKDMADRGMDSAGRVASKTYDALKEEADRQGLAPGEGAPSASASAMSSGRLRRRPKMLPAKRWAPTKTDASRADDAKNHDGTGGLRCRKEL